MKDRYSIIYMHPDGCVEIDQHCASSLEELSKFLIAELKSGKNCNSIIDEERLAINCNLNPYREQFPMIPVEDALNVWSFPVSATDIFIIKMSPIISR